MPESPSRLEALIAELNATPFLGDESVPESFAYLAAYYRRVPPGKKVYFRTASVILILFGAALPVVAAFGDKFHLYSWQPDKGVVVSIMSAVIAFLTGLLSHFRWEVAWRTQTEALFALKAEKTAWDAAVVFARHQDDEAQAVKFLHEAFEQFRTRTFEIVRGEIGEFFKAAQPPSVKPPGV